MTPTPQDDAPATPVMKHTPEPWIVRAGNYVIEIDGPGLSCIADLYPRDLMTPSLDKAVATKQFRLAAGMANASRIVACVNACAGMDDPVAAFAAKGARIEALSREKEEVEALFRAEKAVSAGYASQLVSAEEQRDSLRAQLGEALSQGERAIQTIALLIAGGKVTQETVKTAADIITSAALPPQPAPGPL